MPPNFYYAQEDLLRARQKGRQWHWTALRPEGVLGFGLGNPMNLGMSIAVYATISKELGLPLRFPGSDKAYKALYQVTSAEILAKATVWAGQSDAAKDEIFNITNGDYFRWQYMADKSEVWGEIVRKHNLQPNSFDRVASWQFADAIFSLFFDNITSTIKARRAGFHDCIDTEEMFREFFAGLRADRIIP
jgi:nucleoside-diphosphate-sugar epimerase